MAQDYYGSKTIRGDDEIIVGGFDVETDGLGGQLLSIQWGIFGKIFYDCSEKMVDNFLDYILECPSPIIWYCHFAQYDWRYFMNEFVVRELDVQFHMRDDTNMYQITIKNKRGKKVIMRDSYALWNSTLKKLADSFCPEIPKLDIDIKNFDPKNPEHIEYAKRDVEILITGLPRLFALLKKLFNINPNGTTASTAMKGWQKTLGEETFNSSKHNERELFIRSAYYGGLVFLTDTKTKKDCETYDVNSSYPSVMIEYGVPNGRCFETQEFQTECMGIYRVRIKAPENLIVPIIPARNAKGLMRWFSGEFETSCTNRELIFAANNGYEILEIYEGLCWESVAFPFNEFIKHCKYLRFNYPKGGPEELLAKLMQNSLYGKFGSRRERLRIIAAHSAEPEDLLGAEPYGDDGHWYTKKEFDAEMRCKPEWAVFITAHARLKLLQSVYSVGVENCYYGDTDSITIKKGFGHLIDTGADYGQWKLEKEWKEFRAIAPKVYSGILKDGSRLAAAKGLPKKGMGNEQMRELLEKGETSASVQSLASLRVTLKDGVRKSTTLTRKSTDLRNSLNYELLTDGTVRPKMAA
jgi:hypothetical protein